MLKCQGALCESVFGLEPQGHRELSAFGDTGVADNHRRITADRIQSDRGRDHLIPALSEPGAGGGGPDDIDATLGDQKIDLANTFAVTMIDALPVGCVPRAAALTSAHAPVNTTPSPIVNHALDSAFTGTVASGNTE